MIYENEVTMLVLGISVLVLVFFNRRLFVRLPAWPLLITSFVAQLLAWAFTVIEGFFWPNTANVLEHVGYAVSAVFLAVWCVWVHVHPREGH